MSSLVGTDKWLPVLLVDTDNERVTGVVWNTAGLLVAYQKFGAAFPVRKTLTALNWREVVNPTDPTIIIPGAYEILFTAAERSVAGDLLYGVQVPGSVNYEGKDRVQTHSEFGDADVPEITAIMRARGIAVAEISDDDLTTLLNSLLGEYGRSRPVLAVAVFDTVADQAAYTWAEIGDVDGIEPVQCLWNTGTLTVYEWEPVLLSFDYLAGLSPDDWTSPSLALVNQIKLLQSMQGRTGSGYQITPGGNVILTPAPSESDLSVYLLYTKAYGSLDEIPTFDYDIFCDLAESKCAEVILKTIAGSAVATLVRTPEYEVNVNTQIGVWRAIAKEKLTSFREKCEAGKAAAGFS
jgi:hypothetical protein